MWIQQLSLGVGGASVVFTLWLSAMCVCIYINIQYIHSCYVAYSLYCRQPDYNLLWDRLLYFVSLILYLNCSLENLYKNIPDSNATCTHCIWGTDVCGGVECFNWIMFHGWLLKTDETTLYLRVYGCSQSLLVFWLCSPVVLKNSCFVKV